MAQTYGAYEPFDQSQHNEIDDQYDEDDEYNNEEYGEDENQNVDQYPNDDEEGEGENPDNGVWDAPYPEDGDEFSGGDYEAPFSGEADYQFDQNPGDNGEDLGGADDEGAGDEQDWEDPDNNEAQAQMQGQNDDGAYPEGEQYDENGDGDYPEGEQYDEDGQGQPQDEEDEEYDPDQEQDPQPVEDDQAMANTAPKEPNDSGQNQGQAGGEPPPTQGQPAPPTAPSTAAHSTPGGPTLNIALENTFPDGQVYAFVTGKAIDKNNSLFLLSSDGKTPYYPSATGKLQQKVAISLEAGKSTTITIPHIAGGRIYFSLNKELEFTINEGISLVEPSVTNPSDPNYLTEWGFVELTFNPEQLYANISYVDFVGSIPTGLSLDTASGETQHVSGMAPDGLEGVCQGLMEQHQQDGKGWDQLIVQPEGKPIRVISLNQAVKMKPDLFGDYYDQYIDEVWQHLSGNKANVDTQMASGVVKAHVEGDKLIAGNAQFTKPSTSDVLSCDSGPFATGGDPETNAIIPRIAAAFNRSTFLDTNDFPEDKSIHYKHEVTNHYSRVVHETNVDGKGYAFPYDDVQKTGGPDQSGEVHGADATLLTVTVGGGKTGQQ